MQIRRAKFVTCAIAVVSSDQTPPSHQNIIKRQKLDQMAVTEMQDLTRASHHPENSTLDIVSLSYTELQFD